MPATNESFSFSCRNCGVKDIQEPTFIDTPHLERLDLSWNELTGDVLLSEVFRGPFDKTNYKSINLFDLDVSHNNIGFLKRNVFEHTPNLTKLNLGFNKFSSLDESTTMAFISIGLLEVKKCC